MAASSNASPENVMPLFKAAFRGDLKTVTQLLIPLPGGLTVHSVDKVHVEVFSHMRLSVLLKISTSIRIRALCVCRLIQSGSTVLFAAVSGANLHIVQYLLTQQANVNHINSSKLTPLHVAVMMADKKGIPLANLVDVMDLLVTQGGADFTLPNIRGETAQMLARRNVRLREDPLIVHMLNLEPVKTEGAVKVCAVYVVCTPITHSLSRHHPPLNLRISSAVAFFFSFPRAPQARVSASDKPIAKSTPADLPPTEDELRVLKEIQQDVPSYQHVFQELLKIRFVQFRFGKTHFN
jgi:hypothetical protein